MTNTRSFRYSTDVDTKRWLANFHVTKEKTDSSSEVYPLSPH